MTAVPPDQPSFEAALYPNPPMAGHAFVILMGLLILVNGVAGIAMALAGAWPVSGFMGLDVLLLGAALLVARRRGRCFERITLNADGLDVARHGADGRVDHVRFEPHWVRVLLDQRGPYLVRLWLRSHGRSIRIGAFLRPDECRGLAAELDSALKAYR